ncbi:Protein phosphatase 2C containing protein [Rhynchospora pubera]|uniref:protein-serine/threonine phosphatase n=1 Tax=Rhynchospora pubera TaxID=906938 RepID=A0AAV8B0H4_9POAL|nr:Protein phosphatase 2C containing protein [Rhynchospora pubera]KAJ4756142.1 Protein phosphatase 2C containing protein [Rhynchospora pubera]
MMSLGTNTTDLNVSFGYQCSSTVSFLNGDVPSKTDVDNSFTKLHTSSSFSCLSGAAISANYTLANTNICNGVIASEILPELDSPNSFRKLVSSPSLSKLDLLSSSPTSPPKSTGPPTDCNTSNGVLFEITPNDPWGSSSALTRLESSNFLNSMDVQTAGGAAGEDRVQAVCSERNGLLFCGIYDGFNGRDAADFLASTLYENIRYYLYRLEQQINQNHNLSPSNHDNVHSELTRSIGIPETEEGNVDQLVWSGSFQDGVVDCLVRALEQAENDFLCRVEMEMEDRPDLVSIGSCVLIVLLHGSNLYVLNLGDSRAVLATVDNNDLRAVQLTETHTVDNDMECQKLLANHLDDPQVVNYGKVKGKLKVTRAIGVGYLKKKEFNDALMGILRVKNLCSPPYVYTNPHTLSHKVSENDLFVVLGSDGLYDFFDNDEVVSIVSKFIKQNPFGDPAKYLIEQLVVRAAQKAALTVEELMNVPAGRRRKYHDDVTVIVILLGNNKQRTLTAST